MAQDSTHGSVNYDANDKLCMEGQRLFIASGSYGTDGAVYHTEVESFSKVIEHGLLNSTGTWFEVHTKAGQIMQFGNSSDSAIMTVGLSTNVIRAWAVNKISDTVGNYLTVTYNSGSSYDRTHYSEAYPLEIDYTGNASEGVSPYNSVKFSYQCQDESGTCRTDTTPMYQAGAITQTTVLLTDVRTYQGSNLVYDYRLAYNSIPSSYYGLIATTLASVSLYDAVGAHLNSTTFGWQGGAGYLTMNSTSETVSQGMWIIPGDFNGDGITDILPLSQDHSCNVRNFPIYNGPGFSTTTSNFTLSSALGGADICYLSRFTITLLAPNGVSNVLVPETGKYDGPPVNYVSYLIALNTGNGFYSSPFSLGGASTGVPPPMYSGDYNGDGLFDIFIQATPNSGLYLGNSSGGWPSTYINFGNYNPSTTSTVPADFDGDGCTDIMALGGTTAVAYSSQCNPATSSSTPPTASGYTPVLADFNGDGKTDILLVSASGAAQLWLSTGTGFTEVNSTLPSDWGKYAISAGDFNGDGKADLLLVADCATGHYCSGTSHQVYLSTGTNFVQAVNSSGTPITISNSVTCSSTCVSASVADWNNDGASDIWLQSPASPSGPGDALYTFSYKPQLMTSVSNGIGSTTTVTYAPINTNGSLYTKGTSATYPDQDIDGALYVVSQVDASNGLGNCPTNCYSSTYAYAGAVTNVQGRGFLGFTQVAITDLQTNIIQTTTYDTDCNSSNCFPYIGLVVSQTKQKSGNTHYLSSVVNTYSDNSGCGSGISPPTGVYQVCLTQSVTSGYDLNDTAQLPTTTTNYTYDSNGNALTVNVSVSDGSSKNTTNTYSDNLTNWLLGRLATTSVTSTVGSSVLTRQSSFSYDSTTGLLTEESIEPGVSACNNNASSCTISTSYTYDAFGHRATTTVFGTGITTRTSYAIYDSLGEFQVEGINALGQAETWAYDARFGSPTSHTGPNDLTTNWTYDTFGRMTAEVRPDGTKTTQAYGYCGGSCPTSGQFYAQSEIVNSGSGSQIGPISTATYDMLSRSIATDTQGFDGSTIRVATIYDGNGRVYQTSRPYFTMGGTAKYTTFAYDALGRVTTETFPDTSQSTYTFNGLVTSVTNSLSQATTTTKNAQGLVASVQDPASHTTGYVYDAFGDVLTTTDPAGNVVTNSYDIRGNKIASDDPDMGTWTYSYDVLGELLSQTDAKGQTTTLTYDLLGRTLSRTENGLFSAWTYGTNSGLHDLGKMVEAKACDTSACGTVISDKTFTYDSLTRPAKTVIAADDNNFAYQETYNSANGKLATLAYPSGYSVSYSYNSYGYVTAINGADGALIWQANARDAELHLTSEQQGNGVSTTQTFDPNTGLIQTQQAGASASVANFAYSFDTIGNLKSRTDSIEGFTEQFCYDSLNRLTNSNMGSVCTGGKSVTYDSIGNITAKSDTGSYSYSGAGPHAVSGISGTVDGLTNPQYSYDENGNLTCVSTGSGCSGTVGRTVLSTSFNMAGAILQGANSLNLTYDDQHQRIMQVNAVSGAATTTTVYLNDPASGAMSEQVTNAGTTATVWNSFNWGGEPWGGVTADAIPTWVDYIQVDGQIVAQRSVKYQAGDLWGQQNWGSFSWGTPTAGSNWGAFNWGSGAWTGPVVVWEYFTLDHLNSVAVVTDQGGAVLQRLSYDPWGKARNANGSDAACGAISPDTTRGFTNQEQMPVACLVNLNARLYDASIGKFLAADPVVTNRFAANAYNRYAYALNNPLSLTDPSGNGPEVVVVTAPLLSNPITAPVAAIIDFVASVFEIFGGGGGGVHYATTPPAPPAPQAPSVSVTQQPSYASQTAAGTASVANTLATETVIVPGEAAANSSAALLPSMAFATAPPLLDSTQIARFEGERFGNPPAWCANSPGVCEYNPEGNFWQNGQLYVDSQGQIEQVNVTAEASQSFLSRYGLVALGGVQIGAAILTGGLAVPEEAALDTVLLEGSNAAARGGVINLFRAVNPAELDDLTASGGAFRNPLGIENKYFSTTAEGAASYARETVGTALYEGPYRVVQTSIPTSSIDPIMQATVDRGISTVTVPTELLPQLSPANPLNFTPLP